MTDNMKKFLEEASRDKEYLEKVTRAETPEAVIALAEEKGFTLTAEDLKPDQSGGELSDDEVDAVAGGKACACIGGGGGEEGESDELCWCAALGHGLNKHKDTIRCYCPFVGGGKSVDD